MRRTVDAHDDWFDDQDDWYDDYARAPGPAPLELVRRPQAGVTIVAPEDDAGAKAVADALRDGRLVLVDLRGRTPEFAARLTDFCSGLSYAVDGGLQVVTDGLLLLSPCGVDVTGDEASGVRESGFFNRL